MLKQNPEQKASFFEFSPSPNPSPKESQMAIITDEL